MLDRVLRVCERLSTDSVEEGELLDAIELTKRLNKKLRVYEGYLLVYHFDKFGRLPAGRYTNALVKDERFLECTRFMSGEVLKVHEVGQLFTSILSIPDKESETRDILLGSFYGCLWPFMNDIRNLEVATRYGVELAKSALSMDNLDPTDKIDLESKGSKIVTLAGSGKKKVKLLNISSMTAVITAAVGEKINKSIIVEKTVSEATSSTVGSSEVFRAVGVNLDIPLRKMADLSVKTKLGIFNINNIVPRLNSVYDGRLYDTQVFAGLVGGGAIVCPVESDFINYGLSRGSAKVCLSILSELYPAKNIIITTGKDCIGNPVVDQISVESDTEVAQLIGGEACFYTLVPEDFGSERNSFRNIQSSLSIRDNILEFVRLLSGKGGKDLRQAVAMETSLNLYGLGIIDNLTVGTNLAIETIDSGLGIDLLRNLAVHSNGDIDKLNEFIRDSS